ncbi:protein gp37 [Dokdonella fugitiva]|uniref:Protein gp37 n=1 Tax=Dokdonella fugitiva TaxID=328517 RepID=A0A839FAW3_9GAMM|nr:phage Gp37/Gp68 family protein [Dokdonella fugitiva]MBA8889291.1 protein gp37 [Dokdonella fugitiva]
MSTQSKIEWTEQTWNPVVGCTKVSAGCKHCYAEVMARRLQAMRTPGYEQGFKKIRLRPEKIDEPLRRTKPTVYFVNSMSDLFHPDVPDQFIDQIFSTMAAATMHTFQVLTKRPERMACYLDSKRVANNIWLGTSVENKRHGVPRIAELRKVQAQTRFLSIEPLLEDIGIVDLRGIAWVIVGGESGPKARPMKAEWARKVQAQCLAAGVRFFFKQWGAHGEDGVRRTKKSNGRLLDGQQWDEMPVVALA